eukprot:CAMPEP_0119385974 /NCGR_PEP_ID=MMETSP1334-20130426/93780_1 /TAXON_ID=127549 /ORGANISM="Calcidiscus leptoporus, Strain RCC1130" /LENGTH=35 /DNA_ID= /DNA_START= /DNA_END= /DNA_ORIENTATION=
MEWEELLAAGPQCADRSRLLAAVERGVPHALRARV